MTDTFTMKLTLDVEKPPNGHAFQPGDPVRGRVQLQLPEGLQVPDIQLVFQGSVKISLKPGFDTINQVAETHKQETGKLFCIEKSLVPKRAWKTDASLQTYTAPFSIPFPQYAQCCTRTTAATAAAATAKPVCNLPPSTRIACAGFRVTASYTLTAVCRRPRARASRFNLFACIQRSLSACRVVPFVPPADDQLHVPELPREVPAASVAEYVRPNTPLVGQSEVPLAVPTPAVAAYVRPNTPLVGSQHEVPPPVSAAAMAAYVRSNVPLVGQTELPPVVPTSAVAAYVRPNVPLIGSQPASRPSSRHQQQQQILHAAPPPPPLNSSPMPSRTSVSSASTTSTTSSTTSSSESDTSTLASSRPSLSEAPPLYAPINATADCKLVRSSAFLSTANLDLRLDIDDAPSSKRPSAPGGDASGYLPAYTPSMTLEAVMPNLPVVTPGQPIPLGVFVLAPQPLLAAAHAANCKLVVRTMTVQLRRTTYARIGSSMRVDEALWPLWSYKGSALIDGAKLDAATALRWDTMGVIPAGVKPGFRSCGVARTYSLEVSMGVSTQAAPGTVEHATTSMRVMVSEPPPAYITEA